MSEISDQEWKDWGKGKLPVPLLKRALVEIKRMCVERDDCYGCPFELDMTHMHICKLSPQLYSAIPENWPIDDWKEDGKDA